MSGEITISLAQSPTAPTADFLATVKALSIPSSPSSSSDDDDAGIDHEENLPPKLRIDSYTRAPWSLCHPPSSSSASTTGDETTRTTKWNGVWLHSTDGRGKLPGFLKFLAGRKKAAVAKFVSPEPDETTGAEIGAVLVVPFDPPPVPSRALLKPVEDENADGKTIESTDLLYVRYRLDGRGLKDQLPRPQQTPAVPHQKRKPQMQPPPRPTNGTGASSIRTSSNRRPNTSTTNNPNKNATQSVTAKRGGSKSMFSKMVLSATQKSSSASLQRNKSLSKQPNTNTNQSTTNNFNTALDVISNLRNTLSNTLTTFLRNKSQTVLKIPISLAEHTRNLNDTQKEKVGMEVIKFIVYEQSEEVGEGHNWTCYKEPGEFTDEAVFAVYKEGCVPEDVLEDMMKGDLPDEQKQQSRAIKEAAAKEAERKARADEEQNLRNATRLHADVGEHMMSLNSTKRDRRSIEEIQRDLDGGSDDISADVDNRKRLRM